MDRLINAMKAAASSVNGLTGVNRWGIVTSVDPSRPAVKVLIQPEGVLSGWLPVTQSAASASATIVAIPDVGMQALLVPDMGDAGHYIVAGFAHADNATIPVPPAALPGTLNGTPSAAHTPWQIGEVGIVHKSGSVIRMTAAGTIYVKGNLFLDGSIVANGDVSDRHGSLDRLRGNYDVHVHGGVTPGGSNTATTSAPDPE